MCTVSLGTFRILKVPLALIVDFCLYSRTAMPRRRALIQVAAARPSGTVRLPRFPGHFHHRPCRRGRSCGVGSDAEVGSAAVIGSAGRGVRLGCTPT
ncbi:hypothetical protein ACFFX0_16595 [Citricoccus parietis]|uniref:Secreted protein n=1 Tax=Citricoccus parietis TaxID=592307 RepID=A0ABV5G1B9_9MICC